MNGHTAGRGAQGGPWGEGLIQATYRMRAGRISEMVVISTAGL